MFRKILFMNFVEIFRKKVDTTRDGDNPYKKQ